MTLKTQLHQRYEVLSSGEIWYHGRSVKSEEFSLEHVGKRDANNQEGPGFYLTSSEEDAQKYAYPNGIIMQVKLSPRKLVEGKPKRRELEKLIDMAPDLEMTLTDWDENPAIAKRKALDGAMNSDLAKDAFQQVWYDFYRNEPKEYLVNMMKLGYDGHLATWLTDAKTKHMIVYNPAVIHVVKVVPYAST